MEIEIKPKNYKESDEGQSFAERCTVIVKTTDDNGNVAETEEKGCIIQGEKMVFLNAENVYLPNLPTKNQDIAGAFEEVLGKLQDGEGGDEDWQPPEIPEPGEYEVCMLIEIIPYLNNAVNNATDFGIAMLKDNNAIYGMGPLTVDWGDGTVMSADGFDYDIWESSGQYIGDGWSVAYYGSVNRHYYTQAGQYIIRITANEHSNFLNYLSFSSYTNGYVYPIAIKCGRGIIVGRPNTNTLNDNWFSSNNERLQYVKYTGEGANFPYTGFRYAYNLRRIDTINPHKSIILSPNTQDVFFNDYNLTMFDFSECTEMENVSLRNSGLKKLDLPKCVSIGEPSMGFAQNCYRLTDVNAPVLKKIPPFFCAYCHALSKLSAPLSESVGNHAFNGCYSINKIELPNCISIGDYAFRDCSGITEIYAPNCTSVGAEAFYNCRGLAKAIFADGCVFGTNAFYGCNTLHPKPNGEA